MTADLAESAPLPSSINLRDITVDDLALLRAISNPLDRAKAATAVIEHAAPLADRGRNYRERALVTLAGPFNEASAGYKKATAEARLAHYGYWTVQDGDGEPRQISNRRTLAKALRENPALTVTEHAGTIDRETYNQRVRDAAAERREALAAAGITRKPADLWRAAGITRNQYNRILGEAKPLAPDDRPAFPDALLTRGRKLVERWAPIEDQARTIRNDAVRDAHAKYPAMSDAQLAREVGLTAPRIKQIYSTPRRAAK